MNDDLHLSDAGAKLIQHFEGCLEKQSDGKFRAYKCPAGVLTIGWGTTNEGKNHFDATTRWTAEECHKAFLTDMASFEGAVRKLVTVPLAQHQFDALTSFAYNCGAGALKSSTLLKKVNAKDFKAAAAEFKKWTKGGGRVLPGLVRRRDCESLLFLGIKDDNYDGRPDKEPMSPAHPMPQAVDNPEEKHA
jgi:lysozyme